MTNGPRTATTIEALEGRVMLTAVAPAVEDRELTPMAATAARQTRAVAPTLTVAARRQLLNNWVGSNAKTLRKLLNAGNTAGFDAELLRYMRARTNRHYYFDQDDVGGILNFLNSDGGLRTQKGKKIDRASDIVAHRFPEIVNSTSYDVKLPSGTINWSKQPSSSTNSEFLYSLNRHFFWVDLAMAYRYTGDVKFANELKAQLDSWSRQTPPMSDPGDWHDQRPKWDLFVTAERVKNWMYAYNIVLGTSAWTPEANTLFLHRLFAQGDFLNRAGDRYELESNKATGHATALYEVGMMFPEFRGGAAWQARGQELMFQALAAQFRGDGGHYEQSPQYHGGAMNGFMEAYQLAALNGQNWNKKKTRRLRNIFNYFYQTLSPDGTQAALSDTYRSQGTIVFTTARLVLNQPQWPKSRPRLDDVWTLGVNASKELQSAPTYGTLSGRGQAAQYRESGYYVTRSGDDRDARQLIFDAGPKGGTHGHYDLLNIELYGYGKPLIADPGLMSYSASYAAERKTAISTPAHNTISIDGENHEASENPKTARLTIFKNTAAGVQMAARHYAYTDLDGSPVVARNIWHDHHDTFVVTDFARASDSHAYTQSFNLFTNNTTAYGNGGVRTKTGSGDVLLLPLLLRGQMTHQGNVLLSNMSPPSGVVTGRRFSVNQTAESTVFATVMVTFDNGQVPSVSARWLKMPTAKRSGQIEVIKNGVRSVVYVPMPDLGKSPSAVVAPRPAPTTFSLKAIEDENDAGMLR